MRSKKEQQNIRTKPSLSPWLGLVDERSRGQLAPLFAVWVLALGPDLLDQGRRLQGLRGDKGHEVEEVEEVEVEVEKRRRRLMYGFFLMIPFFASRASVFPDFKRKGHRGRESRKRSAR